MTHHAQPRLNWRPKRGQADCFEGFAGLVHFEHRRGRYRVSRTAELWHWYTIQEHGGHELQSRPYLDAASAMAGAQRHFEEVILRAEGRE